jgi:cell wall-associated NlpC family hydrolase
VFPHTRHRHRRSLAIRAAVVAGTTAAAAILGTLPAAPSAAPVPVQAAPVTVALPVAPVALVAPAPAAALAVPTRGAATTAIAAAMSKIGAPYQWGAEGPNAFDCSGLVQWAYKHAGINLPRISRQQAHVGTPVAKSDLRPGDLVFFYRPIRHVGIYIGDGKIVHASGKKSPVKVSSISRMKFTAARRI